MPINMRNPLDVKSSPKVIIETRKALHPQSPKIPAHASNDRITPWLNKAKSVTLRSLLIAMPTSFTALPSRQDLKEAG
jgi:hypothetical protein